MAIKLERASLWFLNINNVFALLWSVIVTHKHNCYCSYATFSFEKRCVNQTDTFQPHTHTPTEIWACQPLPTRRAVIRASPNQIGLIESDMFDQNELKQKWERFPALSSRATWDDTDRKEERGSKKHWGCQIDNPFLCWSEKYVII